MTWINRKVRTGPKDVLVNDIIPQLSTPPGAATICKDPTGPLHCPPDPLPSNAGKLIHGATKILDEAADLFRDRSVVRDSQG